MNMNLDENRWWDQLRNAIHLRSAQDQVLWTIFGIFGAANAILLVALFQNEPGYPWVIISLAGVSASIVWHLLLRRALGHVEMYKKIIEELERRLQIEPELALSGHINEEAFDKHLGKGTPARDLMRWFSLGVAIAWGSTLVCISTHILSVYLLKCWLLAVIR